jgi:hypothetical protein
MLNKGKQDLSKIPGVLNVEIGRSIDAQSRYNYCWLVRVANEEVLRSYKKHSIYESYAAKYFRPLASETVAIDYEILDAVG